MIDPDIEQELYQYIGGICKHLACNPVMVGGYRNHIHILCMLSRKIVVMDLLQEVKQSSSKWVKTMGEE